VPFLIYALITVHRKVSKFNLMEFFILVATMGERITANAKMYCPISSAAEILADHWSVVILRDIAIFDQRTFNLILANNNEKISSGTLAARLGRMCDIGLLIHHCDPYHSQRKIYCLTSKAIELIPILVSMSAWALKHNAPCLHPNAFDQKRDTTPSPYAKELVEKVQRTQKDIIKYVSVPKPVAR